MKTGILELEGNAKDGHNYHVTWTIMLQWLQRFTTDCVVCTDSQNRYICC